eukprot:gnl/Spiro4/3014_TR1486_c0_g1_i1.p1 gnl/Spiro4/3014_TR1486_c0_g1~~gnl/Spiro4/3014_TR1486_c0_g1_i1.p1  ORF type:complete len:983 (+),score=201.46 gnl/Spiro4/3014_TR1486_c0_g1_i1:99-2951(+)
MQRRIAGDIPVDGAMARFAQLDQNIVTEVRNFDQTNEVAGFAAFGSDLTSKTGRLGEHRSNEISGWAGGITSAPKPLGQIGGETDAASGVIVRMDSQRPLWKKLIGTMPEAAVWVQQYAVLEFFDSALRGVGQMMFCNNPISGVFLLVAIVVYSRFLLTTAVFGVLCATSTAYLLGLPRNAVRSGLFSFNGALSALAVTTWQTTTLPDPDSWGWDIRVLFPVFFVSIWSVFLCVILGDLLVKRLGVSYYGLPFIISVWTFCFGAFQYGHFLNRGLTDPALVTTFNDPAFYDTASTFKALMTCVSQALYLTDWRSGLIMLGGIAVATPISMAMAVNGAGIAILTHLILGGPLSILYNGVWGFNAVLTNMAIGGMFYTMSWTVWALSSYAAFVTVFVSRALSIIFTPLGVPPMGTASALVSIGFVLMGGSIRNAVAVPLDRITIPEDHVRRQALALSTLSRFPIAAQLARHLASSSASVDMIEKSLVPPLLCWAALRGSVQGLASLMRNLAHPDWCDYDGRTAAHIAAAEGHTACVAYLASHGADLNCLDVYGNTPLAEAIRSGQREQARIIHSAGGRANVSLDQQCTELCIAASTADVAGLSVRLLGGYSVNVPDYDGRTPLHVAASFGFVQIVEILLTNGAATDARDHMGATPIDDARRLQHAACVSLLEEAAADATRTVSPVPPPTQRQFRNRPVIELFKTPELFDGILESILSSSSLDREQAELIPVLLNVAAASNNLRALETLMGSPLVSIDVADYDGQTALHVAVASGHITAVELLVGSGAALSPLNRWKRTPLDLAVGSATGADSHIIEFLVKSGAQLSCAATNDYGWIACELCNLARSNNVRALRLWIATGVSMGLSDYDKRTPLHVAAESAASRDAVALLLHAGASSTARDAWGMTPLDCAVRAGTTANIEVLKLGADGGELPPLARLRSALSTADASTLLLE